MPIDHIQPYLISNMSSNAHRALTLLLNACKVFNEGMVEDECHLLFTCSAYSAIRARYDDILRGSDNLSAILRTSPRRLSSYVYALFTHRDFVLQCMNTPF